MILTSFFRKKSTQLYLLILTILFLIITIIEIFTTHLTEIDNKKFMEISLIYIESPNNLQKDLENNKFIDNIKQTILFQYENGFMSETMLKLPDLNDKILVYKGVEETLKDNEIIILLSKINYINIEPLMNNYINNEITFSYSGEEIKFQIKKIENVSNKTEIIISPNLFNRLIKKEKTYKYTSNITSENKEAEIYSKYSKNNLVKILNSETAESARERKALQENLEILKISNYIIITIFIIVIFITNKNIIADLEKNIDLEKKLGFKNKQIKLNVLKRILVLHFTIMATVIVVCLILLVALNKLTLLKNINLLFVLIIILLSDLVLGFNLKINQKNYERR